MTDPTPPMESPGLEIAFTDAGGRHWVRRVTGNLCERDSGALDHYNIESPVEYDLLRSALVYRTVSVKDIRATYAGRSPVLMQVEHSAHRSLVRDYLD